MHRALRAGYAAAAQLARGAAAVVPSGDSKLLRALAARRGIRARYAAWGRTGRDPARPLLWMHAPSVGEGLQARPVLELFRRQRSDVQLAYSHFSPSALAFAASLDVDFHDYLPFDTAGDARVALDALRPSALVFSKLDVWPVLATQAAARGVRLGLVSATLSSGSSRRSRLAGALLRDAYARLDVVGAIDGADADRLVALGAPPTVVHVTGDTRYDQVWQRAQRIDRDSPQLSRLTSDRPTLVAGSTWPADEDALLPAWSELRARLPDARLIVAPHEPTPSHLAPIERWGAREGLRVARLGADDASVADLVIVDRTGVLGDLYAIAHLAFVGGGFHSAGLHSVLEPAAFGIPVIFGPQHHASRDAGLLLVAGGGASASDSASLSAQIRRWLGDSSAREDAGLRARSMVRAGLGAAARSFELVEGLI